MEARLTQPKHTSSGRFRLEGFSSIRQCHKKGEEVSSGPIINIGGEKFDIVVYPAGAEDSDPGYAGVYVGRLGGKGSLRIEFSLSSLHSHVKMNEPSLVEEFRPNMNSGFPNFLEVARLKELSRGSTAEDVLIVEASVTVWGNTVVDVKRCTSQDQPPPPRCSLAENMEAMWQSEWWSDLTLVSGDKRLKAHRLILASRSPVFKRMLSTDMAEASSGTVEMPDVQPEVLSRLCEFMYTDVVQGEEAWADDEAIRNLMLVAEKYEVLGLVNLCANKALARLQPHNAASWLILATQLNGQSFKDSCLQYVVDNLADVQETDGWEQLMQNRQIMAELGPVIIRAVCPPAKKQRKGK